MSLWSSLRLSLAALVGMALWLGLGAVMVGQKALLAAFRGLEGVSLWSWALGPEQQQPELLTWLLILFILAGLLLTNLAVCTWTRLLTGPAGRSLRRYLALTMHILALVVIGLQGASFFLAAHKTQVRLLPGQTAELAGGLALRLEQVRFTSDPALLKLKYAQARRHMSRTSYNRQRNVAQVAFVRDERVLASSPLRYFEPQEQDGWRVFLVGFFQKGQDGQAAIGAVLNLVRSPLWPPFALAYLGLIAAFGLLLIWEMATARRPARA